MSQQDNHKVKSTKRGAAMGPVSLAFPHCAPATIAYFTFVVTLLWNPIYVT